MEIVGVDGKKVQSKCPAVKDVEPFGSLVLVELLNADEMLSTNLYIKEDADMGNATQQAYVLKLGPNVSKEVELQVGDRIAVVGTYTPAVNFNGSKRKKGLIELHNIKAILKEA